MCLNTALLVNIPPHCGGQEIRKNMEVESMTLEWRNDQLVKEHRLYVQELTYMSRNTKHLSS